jgi:hypothetical protein
MRLLISNLFCSSVMDTFGVGLSDGVDGLHTSTASSLHLPPLVTLAIWGRQGCRCQPWISKEASRALRPSSACGNNIIITDSSTLSAALELLREHDFPISYTSRICLIPASKLCQPRNSEASWHSRHHSHDGLGYYIYFLSILQSHNHCAYSRLG